MLPNLTIPNLTIPSGKRKLSEHALNSRDDFRYSRFKRVRLNGIKGTLYFSDSVLSDEIKQFPAKYSNVAILSSRSEYAPELSRPIVFVADKGIPRND